MTMCSTNLCVPPPARIRFSSFNSKPHVIQLKKRETQLKQKEELADGLHLIDFEQLKIENQTYNEKIEERNEELLKLRKKITTTVQVSHTEIVGGQSPTDFTI